MMKYILILIGISLSFVCRAQDTLTAPVSNHEILINTIGINSIVVNVSIDFSGGELSGYSIDDETFDTLNSNIVANLASNKFENVIHKGETISLTVAPRKIVFSIFNASDELIHLLSDSIADIYIQTNGDIVFFAWDGSDESTLTPLKLDQLQIEKNTRSSGLLTRAMAEELIDAKGGAVFLTQNQFNFGFIPAGESSSNKMEFNLNFKYRTSYSFIKKAPVFFYSEGLISTNARDSLNYFSVQPVNYNFFKGTHELIGQLGIESDQFLENYRISGNFYWNGIIPNLVNFTFGEDRLRLKPVIKAGLKIYQEIENNRPVELGDNKLSNQVFSEFYYYIPIKKIYSLILEGSAFYDFNINVNPGKNIMFNYSATLGIDIPKTDFKTIFKYTKGENGISYQTNEYLMIGLMVDLFGIK